MKQFLSYAILPLIIFFTSCNDNVEEDTPATETVLMPDTAASQADRHNAVSSLDWDGIYKGILPCADCEGIATELTLNKDLTYTITTSYLGKPGNSTSDNGKFNWDAGGSSITLEGLINRPVQYFVGENHLRQLDMTGHRITGDLADKYVLAKTTSNAASVSVNANVPLLETSWRLVALNGQRVAKAEAGKREKHIILKAKDNRLQGFAGCNTMMGTYEVKEGNLIRIKKIASTRMACDDMTTEAVFLKVLEQLDNYTISGNVLSLNKAKMAPLARFEAE